MDIVTDRIEYEILSVLDRKNRAVDSGEIEEELQKIGIKVSRRRIIQYLDVLDEKGFSENLGRAGRKITKDGKREVENAFVQGKLNYIAYKTMKLANEMTFDLDKKKGSVIANLSIFDEKREGEVDEVLGKVCDTLNLTSPLIKKEHSSGKLCDYQIPDGKVGLATISSITLDGLLLNSRIYTVSTYCGCVEFYDRKPVRFTKLAPTKGCSFDPLRIFMGAERSSINDVADHGCGLVPADYREYLNMMGSNVTNLLKDALDIFGGKALIGKPNTALLGLSPTENYGGITAFGGEVLISALDEAKIPLETKTIHSTIDFNELEPIAQVKGELVEI